MTTRRHDADASNPLTAAEVEATLAGHSEMAGVSEVLDTVRVAATVAPDAGKVDAMASQLALAAREAAPAGAAALEPGISRQRSSAMKARARIASAAGAAIALALGTAGVAAASEDALPGDPLYVIKRTLEDIGVYEGGIDERVEESLQLAEEGDEDAALDHLADSLEEEGEEEPAEELRHAAEAVLSGGSEQSLAVRTAVAEMLQWMAETDATGRDFGQGVAERARAINGAADEEPVVDEPVDGEPVEGEPAEGDSSTTDGKGKPENPGKPDNPGKPENPGKPANPGKPENPGKPANPGKPSRG